MPVGSAESGAIGESCPMSGPPTQIPNRSLNEVSFAMSDGSPIIFEQGMKDVESAARVSADGTVRWTNGNIEYALTAIFGTTLLEQSLKRTEGLLGIMGYRKLSEEGNRTRYAPGGDARGRFLDVVVDKNAQTGRMGAGTRVKPFLCEDMLPRGVNVAQSALRRRSVVYGAGSAKRIAAADDVGAGRMDPGARLQAFRKIRFAVERAGHRALPMAFGLNLHQRPDGAQRGVEPAEFMLEDGRIPEIGGGEKQNFAQPVCRR